MDRTDSYRFSINLESEKIGRIIRRLPLFSFSDKLKKAFKEEIVLRDGLKIVVNEYKLRRTIQVDFSIGNAPLEFAICMQGAMRVDVRSNDCLDERIDIAEGDNSIFFLPNSEGELYITGNTRVKVLSIHVSPDYLQNFVSNDSQGFPPQITDLLNDSLSNAFVIKNKSNSAIKTVASQILENFYSGSRRNMFLEAKSLEFMTLLLSQLTEDSFDKGESISILEREKILELEAQLILRLHDVPSLEQISKETGISHSSLNRIFKAVFGDTIFSYLRNKRLERTKELLQDGKLNISEISYELGWSSPAHLTRNFKEKYGVLPKEYRRRKK